MLAHLEQECGGLEPRPKFPQKLRLAGNSALGASGRAVGTPKGFVVSKRLEIVVLWGGNQVGNHGSALAPSYPHRAIYTAQPPLRTRITEPRINASSPQFYQHLNTYWGNSRARVIAPHATLLHHSTTSKDLHLLTRSGRSRPSSPNV